MQMACNQKCIMPSDWKVQIPRLNGASSILVYIYIYPWFYKVYKTPNLKNRTLFKQKSQKPNSVDLCLLRQCFDSVFKNMATGLASFCLLLSISVLHTAENTWSPKHAKTKLTPADRIDYVVSNYNIKKTIWTAALCFYNLIPCWLQHFDSQRSASSERRKAIHAAVSAATSLQTFKLPPGTEGL